MHLIQVTLFIEVVVFFFFDNRMFPPFKKIYSYLFPSVALRNVGKSPLDPTPTLSYGNSSLLRCGRNSVGRVQPCQGVEFTLLVAIF